MRQLMQFLNMEISFNKILWHPVKEKRNPGGFEPDTSIFKNYRYRLEYVERMLKNYVYLNRGWPLTLTV